MPDTVADEAQTDAPTAPAVKRTTAMVAAEAEEMASTALGIIEHQSGQLKELGERLDALQSGLPEAVGAEVGKIAAKFQEWAEKADERLDRLEKLTTGDMPLAWVEALDALDSKVAVVSDGLEAHAQRLENVGQTDARAVRPAHGGPGVYAKVSALMDAVQVIGRDRLHDAKNGPKFKFRGVDDAMDAVGHAMRQVGLVMETRILDKSYSHNEARNSSGNTLLWTTCSLTVEYTFIDPADGSRQTFQMVGEGRDSSDKATSKAASMALKYGLFQALMIPVTGLDDADTESPQVAREAAAQRPQGGQQQPAQPRAEDLSPEDRARNALTALRALPRYPLQEQVARFNDIRKRIDAGGIGHVVVEDARLDAWVQSVSATLIRPPAEPQEEPRSHHPDPYAPNHYGYGDHPAESGY